MLSMKGLLVLIMFLAGGLAAIQGALNTQLSKHIGSPIQASSISFCIGAIVLAILLILSKDQLPSPTLLLQVPRHYLLGGLCGSILITCMIFLIPRIGVVNVLFLGLAGQLIVAVAIDAFGLFGLKPQPLSWVKVIRSVVILSGVGLPNYDAKKINSSISTRLSIEQVRANQLAHKVNPRFGFGYAQNHNAMLYSLNNQRREKQHRRECKQIVRRCQTRLCYSSSLLMARTHKV